MRGSRCIHGEKRFPAEWCWDNYNFGYSYPTGHLIDFLGAPAESIGRIVLGGSWDYPDAIGCSLNHWIQCAKSIQDEGIGFRVVRR